MKKLITILFLFAFTINAQIELSESYAFTSDKELHVYVAAGSSAGIYLFTYYKTKDEGLAFRAGWIVTSIGSIVWEGVGMLAGKEISLGDMGYSTLSAFATSGLMYVGTKIIKKIKKNKINKRFDVSDNIYYSLDNPIFTKK